MTTSPIIVAVDKHNLNDALALADSLDPSLCRLKVGKELFTVCGSEVVKTFHQRGFDVFLDLKFHDIPNTTAQAVLAAADMGVWLTNIHASVGVDAMKLCKSRLQAGGYQTMLIAVTVLTSMRDADLAQLGIARSASEQVVHLAGLTHEAGLDGVVCSAQEASLLKQKFGKQFQLITPGIRLADDDKGDQARICTPQEAKQLGADFLVIGRSITTANNPNEKLRLILSQLN